jgi:hypothetical protein
MVTLAPWIGAPDGSETMPTNERLAASRAFIANEINTIIAAMIHFIRFSDPMSWITIDDNAVSTFSLEK